MRSIAITFTVACLSLSQFAVGADDRNVAIPQTGFSSFEEMKRWSETSTCCGGWSERLVASEEEVHWSTRTFTSGRATTEIVFWGRSGERILPRLILPMRYGEYKVVAKDMAVVIQRYESNSGFVDVMTIDVALFSDTYVFGKRRAHEKKGGEPGATDNPDGA